MSKPKPTRARQEAGSASHGLKPARSIVHENRTPSLFLGELLRTVRSLVLTALFPVILLPLACQQFPDPFKDELAGRPPVSTASADGIRSRAPEREAVRHRWEDVVKTETARGGVTHGPLYFEDPHESPADADRRFVWALEDYWNLLYGPCRFLVDIAAFPVSTVVTPPWAMMESGAAMTGAP